MADIGYLEALRLWFSGDSGLQDASMYGVSMLWWGRFGKVAAFLGGMTVVLDILGPDRIREYGGRLRAMSQSRAQASWIGLITGAAGLALSAWAAAAEVAADIGRGLVALALLVVTLVLVVAWVASATARSKLFENTIGGVASALEHPRLLLWWRVISLFALVVGFHLDLLAS